MKARELQEAISGSAQILNQVSKNWRGDAEIMSWAVNPDMWDVYAEDGCDEWSWEFYHDVLGDTKSPLVAVVSLNTDELEDQEMVYVFGDGSWKGHSDGGGTSF